LQGEDFQGNGRQQRWRAYSGGNPSLHAGNQDAGSAAIGGSLRLASRPSSMPFRVRAEPCGRMFPVSAVLPDTSSFGLERRSRSDSACNAGTPLAVPHPMLKCCPCTRPTRQSAHIAPSR
jgi:hypothetical protein